ncbi:hypothetical protein EBI00_02300 [Marinomonas hwangdonensis]|uniref:Uncharacterized protein n=1 Tax=Marinomonas hwangdonensis TaxID=1053647 RepID=A0A3M8QBA2_9GAMM|nr:hypothetical protein [Marinomonas hwangdonensis]RNF52952.1 hypothetical protein EBI00_02300 [Marinomonas hwangdonensis]
MVKKTFKLVHWFWTIFTLVIAGFWFIHHGGANWVPVPISVVSKAIAETVDEKGIEIMTSSPIATHVHADAVSIAAQLGRMDMASLAMTAISVVFAILGIFGFMHLKDRAEYIAKKTTEECFESYKEGLTSKLDGQVASYMEASVPVLFDDYAELFQHSLQAANDDEDDDDDIAPGPGEGV